MTAPQSPVTLITGGASGLGAATARRLLANRHRVAVTGRDKSRLDRFTEEMGAGEMLLTLPGDAADETAVDRAVTAVLDRYGRLDMVVANAGFNTFDSLVDGNADHWRDMLLTNVLGPALLVKAALPALRDSHGRIVLIGSEAGVVNRPGNMYSVTKWAVTAFAENTRLLVTPEGIGVTMIAPGPVNTPFYAGRDGGIPGGPILTPEHIADAIAWVFDRAAGVDVNTIVVRPTGRAG